MQVIEYVQFQPHSDYPPMFTHDPDDCESGQVLCIRKDGKHWHVETQPFTLYGKGFVHADHDAGELVPMLYKNFLAEITSMINGKDDFMLSFTVTGCIDYESGHVDEWRYELLGKLVQDGNNLVVKPLEVNA